MSKYILLLILIIPFCGTSQISDKLRNEAFSLEALMLNYPEVAEKIQSFIGEELDEVDIQMLAERQTIGMLVMNLTLKDEDTEMTYGLLYDTFVDVKVKGGESYEKSKASFIKMNPFKTLPATKENWEKMAAVFDEMSEEEFVVSEIEPWVLDRLNEDKTMLDVLKEAYRAKQKDEFDNDEYRKKVESLFISDAEIAFDLYKDLSEAVGKPMVLYFTGYNCVNCRKLEEGVFKDPRISSSLADDFVFFPAYVDSRQELIEELQGTVEYNGRTYDLKTNGDYNMWFQIKHFNMSTQPYLVFMYSNGDVIETASYESHNSVREMKDLLEEVLVKYHEK